MTNPFDQFDSVAQPNAFDQFDAVAQAPQQFDNEDVPRAEGLPPSAWDTELEAKREAKRNRSLGDIAEGVGETALTIGTGATTGALGFLGGSIEAAIGKLTGGLTEAEAIKLVQERSGGMTNMPESEAGKEYVKWLGDKLGALPPVLGTGPVGVAGRLNIDKVNLSSFKESLSKSKSLLAQKLASKGSEQVLKSFKNTGDKFKPRIFGMVKEARKQGFDEGMTTVIANASPIDKRRMLQQINILEKGKADSLYQAKNRPADIAGTSLLRQVDFIKSNNKQAGKQLGRIADTLKGKEVDVSEPIVRFVDDLADMGVRIGDDGVPTFEGSLIEFSGPAKKLVENTLIKIKRKPAPDALEAHEFKKFLDEDLKHGKQSEGGVSGKMERVLGDLRSGVNRAIGDKFEGYREANARFSDTIKSLDMLQDAAGKKLDFFGPNADKATGTVLRRLMSNAQGRVLLMDAVDDIGKTSKKYGGSFNDDILTQMLFADELDSVFGGGGRTSLKGEVKKANVDAAVDISQMTIPGAVATGVKAGAKYARGINEKNQLKAIKALLKAK